MSNILNDNPYQRLKKIVSDDLDQINNIILKLTQSHVHLIPEIINHLFQSGGKRIRPLLTLASAKLIGCQNNDIIKLAASVEFIHTATLFHDDVIDESKLRRGKLTANSIWDNKASILVGDFLLSHAFKLMVECKNLTALEMLANVSITITEAEVWQLDLIGKLENSEEDYINLVIGKTASLFATSCTIAGVLNYGDKSIIDALYNYGLNLGILFQISDDMLDYCAIEKVFGKKLGSDFIEKKITLPLIYLLKAASEEDKKIIMTNFYSDKPNISKITNFINLYNIPDKVSNCIANYQLKAEEALSKLPSNLIREEFQKLLYYIAIRKS